MTTNHTNQEIEVKFYLKSLPNLQARLERLGAKLAQPRGLERNLRFDRPGGELSREGRVLRLRQDSAARLTYKGPGELQGGVQARVEIEFTVDDFKQAQAFLEALGYSVWAAYEKYRATYALDDALVTLDELPFGSFAEIEAPTPEAVARAAKRLEVDWEERINTSYMALFEHAREAMGYSFRDLTFENFRGLRVPAEALGVRPAD